MSDTDGLGNKLIRLAEGVLDDLLVEQGEKPAVDQRIDAIKAIGTLHLGLLRQSGKNKGDDDDDGSVPSMSALRNRIKGSGEGK